MPIKCWAEIKASYMGWRDLMNQHIFFPIVSYRRHYWLLNQHGVPFDSSMVLQMVFHLTPVCLFMYVAMWFRGGRLHPLGVNAD